jgi:hypothetical protein
MIEMTSDGTDIFVVVDGVKVAKRGRPGHRRLALGSHLNRPEAIEVTYNGARVH